MRLPFPFGGISDNVAYSDQEPTTTRDGVNVRGIDPVTGRIRGAQRSGLSAYSSGALGPAPVKALVQVTYSNDQLIYAENDPPVIEASSSKVMPSEDDCWNVKTDSQGNVYALHGNGELTVYNTKGKKLRNVSLAIKDDDHLCRALWIDDLDQVFVAVSAGGQLISGDNKKLGRIWKYVRDPDHFLAYQWQINLDRYVEDIRAYDGRLYTAQNLPTENKAWLVAYDFIDSTGPELAFERQIPFPAHGIDVRTDTPYEGAIYIASAANEDRGAPPSDTSLSPVVEEGKMWNPTHLTKFQQRIWGWWKGDSLGNDGDLSPDGKRVLRWVSHSGHLTGQFRNLYAHGGHWPDFEEFTTDRYATELTAPEYIGTGLAGRAGVRFDGQAGLFSIRNWTGTSAGSASTQSTILPGYTGNMSAMFMVVELEDSGTEKFCVFSQEVYNDQLEIADGVSSQNWSSGGDSEWWRAIVANRKASLDPDDETAKFGQINYNDFSNDTDEAENTDYGAYGAGGADNPQNANQPHNGHYRNPQNVAIISIINNGNVSGPHKSIWRVNGTPIDIYTGHGGVTRNQSTLGYLSAVADDATNSKPYGSSGGGALSNGNWQPMRGTIYEVITFRDSIHFDSNGDPVENGGTKGIFQHPNYPDKTAPTTPDQGFSSATSTEVEKMEAYLAWKYGVAHLLDDGTGGEDGKVVGSSASYTAGGCDFNLENYGNGTNQNESEANSIYGPTTNGTAGLTTAYPHPHQLADGPPLKDGTYDENEPTEWSTLQLSSPNPLVSKFGPNSGGWKWTYGGEETPRGAGWAVAAAPSKRVYSVGPDATNPVWPPNMHRYFVQITDNGTTFTVTSAKLEEVPEFGYEFPRIAVDKNDNLYIPFYIPTLRPKKSLVVIAPDTAAPYFTLEYYQLPDEQQAHAVALGPHPDYDEAYAGHDLAEYVWLGTRNDDGAVPADTKTLNKVLLVEPALAASSVQHRNITYLGVCNGDIKKFPTVALPVAGGEDALAVDASLISAATFQGKVYFSDGNDYKTYDPVDDRVSAWVATSIGEIPERYKLLAAWRNRLVIAHGDADPTNWAMSAFGDAFDWDFAPAVPTSTQAVAGNLAQAGLAPDIVTALIPYSDDLLIFGGDSSIWRLTGDPMAGGEFDNVSVETGIAYGRAWTRDPEGVLYFFGSRGGVYRMDPYGGAFERISLHRIERRLQSVDLATYRVELNWNYHDEGLHVFLVPRGAASARATHYFWEQKTGAWWEDEFGTDESSYTRQPTASLMIDGDDPDDRRLLIGCNDGTVRVVDRTAVDDDDQAIDSRVLIGPLQSPEPGWEAVWNEFTGVLAHADESTFNGEVEYQLFESDTADRPGLPIRTGTLKPGRNPTVYDRMRGAFCWVQLRSAIASQRWALERLFINGEVAGKERVRG
jgi:hypothetical protein